MSLLRPWLHENAEICYCTCILEYWCCSYTQNNVTNLCMFVSLPVSLKSPSVATFLRVTCWGGSGYWTAGVYIISNIIFEQWSYTVCTCTPIHGLVVDLNGMPFVNKALPLQTHGIRCVYHLAASHCSCTFILTLVVLRNKVLFSLTTLLAGVCALKGIS